MRDDIDLRWIVALVLFVLQSLCLDVEQDHASVVINALCAINYVSSIQIPASGLLQFQMFSRNPLVRATHPHISQ